MTAGPPLRLVVVGLTGRMGREIAALAATDDTLTIVGGVGRNDLADLPTIGATGDVLIDFSTPEATGEAIAVARAARLPLVTGTTGLDVTTMAELHDLSVTVPVWYARNMSTGVSLLQRLLPEVARALAGFDVEVLEAHHRHKVDAPSGTALMLAEAILAGLAGDAPPFVHGREGYAPRKAGEIGFHAIRSGGNPGEHTVLFASEQEEVRISHRAFTRQVFAAGAIRAARAIHGAEPGWYGPELVSADH